VNTIDQHPTESDDSLELDDGPATEDRSDEREIGMGDLSGPATHRIRRFVADSTAKGGASPADVADLYTTPEIMADSRATAYLDRRYVHGEMPGDWRQLQDDLSEAQRTAPPGASGEALLARTQEGGPPARVERSIFDDPDDLDELDLLDDRGSQILERDPSMDDLYDEGRRAIERHIVAEVMSYGMAPIRTMQLREQLHDAGDERSLQYLDLPFETGERPPDWDELRDRALRLRAHLESRGQDPANVFARTEAAHPELTARELLGLLEEAN
jgi:hypothetical protein